MLANANLMNCVFIVLLMLGAYLFLLVPILIYFAIQHMRSPHLILLPQDDWNQYFEEKCRAESDWADSNNFVQVGVYRVQQNYILVWEQTENAKYFQSTLSPYGRFHNFTTVFEDDYSLLTANDRESLVFPHPPRRFVQSFGIETMGELHEKHESAAASLINVKGLELPASLPEFEELYLSHVFKLHEHVRSFVLYPIRGIWWYHVVRRMKFNRSIDLHQAVLDN